MRIRKTSRLYTLKAGAALAKLRAERIKLKTLESDLKTRADTKFQREEQRFDTQIEEIERLKNECFLSSIQSLQNRLEAAYKEIAALKDNI